MFFLVAKHCTMSDGTSLFLFTQNILHYRRKCIRLFQIILSFINDDMFLVRNNISFKIRVRMKGWSN